MNDATIGPKSSWLTSRRHGYQPQVCSSSISQSLERNDRAQHPMSRALTNKCLVQVSDPSAMEQWELFANTIEMAVGPNNQLTIADCWRGIKAALVKCQIVRDQQIVLIRCVKHVILTGLVRTCRGTRTEQSNTNSALLQNLPANQWVGGVGGGTVG